MGSLHQAENEYQARTDAAAGIESRIPPKAPWEGATPEEDAAYAQSVELGDTEFEREVSAHGGPSIAPFVDADYAKTLNVDSDQWTISGFNIPQRHATSDAQKKADDFRYGRLMAIADEKIEADTVYAVGPGAATNDLWSHEFQHRSKDQRHRSDKDPNYMLALGSWEERDNRRFAGFRASNADQWMDAVESWRDWVMTHGGPKKMNLQEADESLKKSIDIYSRDYIAREAEVLEEKYSHPRWKSKYGEVKSNHEGDQRDRYESRQKRWNMEDSYRHKQMKLAEAKKKMEKSQKDADRMEYRKRFMELQDALDKAATKADRDLLLNQWDKDVAEGIKAPEDMPSAPPPPFLPPEQQL